MTTKYESFIALCRDFKASEDDNFDKILAQALVDLSLLRAQLAELCEVGPSTMSRWINKKSRPMKQTRSAIVEELAMMAARLQADVDQSEKQKTETKAL